ncbi:hypothetical protein [Nocardia brasiliensis]|nr:hypothetical protein [Nocardia brasiliensis]
MTPPTAVPASEYTFPAEWAGDYTFRWSSAGGIDLMSPHADVVRAFAESKRLAMSVGNELAYPGYAAAISTVGWLDIPPGGSYPLGVDQGDWNLRWRGTFLARIMQLQPESGGFTAAYCLDYTNVADSIDGGAHYRWSRPGQRGEPRHGWLIGFTAQARDGSHTERSATSAIPAVRHAARAPRHDVFDGWTITEVWGPKPRGIENKALIDACTAWTRANPQTNPLDMDNAERRIPADPPPTPAPSFPGWPEPGN